MYRCRVVHDRSCRDLSAGQRGDAMILDIARHVVVHYDVAVQLSGKVTVALNRKEAANNLSSMRLTVELLLWNSNQP